MNCSKYTHVLSLNIKHDKNIANNVCYYYNNNLFVMEIDHCKSIQVFRVNNIIANYKNNKRNVHNTNVKNAFKKYFKYLYNIGI